MARKNVGWRKEPARHALAAKGVRTVPRDQLVKMPWPSVEALSKVNPTTGALERINKEVTRVDREIKDYRDDPIMFTYVRLDEEITALEKELSTYTGQAAANAATRVQDIRRELEESETPWTD